VSTVLDGIFPRGCRNGLLVENRLETELSAITGLKQNDQQRRAKGYGQRQLEIRNRASDSEAALDKVRKAWPRPNRTCRKSTTPL